MLEFSPERKSVIHFYTKFSAVSYTVAAWLHTWYELYAKPNIRLATQNRYELMMSIYAIPHIGDIKLSKLTSRDLQKLYRDLQENGRVHATARSGNGLSSTTVRSLHLMLHCAFDRAVKERLIQRNPTDDCIAQKVRKAEMNVLSLESIKAYLKAAAQRDALPMFYLELVSGLRKGELVALLWSDVDTAHNTISVSKQYVRNPTGKCTLSQPKTENSIRLVSVPQGAVDLLITEHNKHPDSPYLFPSPITGGMCHPDLVVNIQVPDGDTLGRFRNILVRNGLQERLFAQVVELLQKKGLLLKKGLKT